MVFDWDKAARLIQEKKPKWATAGLRGDWEYTGGTIYEDGKPVMDDASNLEWVTHSENIKHAIKTGLIGDCAKKATADVVRAIRAEYIPNDRKHSTTAIAKKYGLSAGYVWKIISGGKRKMVADKEDKNDDAGRSD